MDATDTDSTQQVSTAARLLDRLVESRTSLDGSSRLLRPLAERARGKGSWRRLVTGEVIGHAAHPFLTDLPIGFWASAGLLDVVGGPGAAPAARQLVGWGLATSPAAALTGMAEYAALAERPQRVASVHAGLNSVGMVLMAASWAARPRRRALGVSLGLAGLAVTGASAYLGGHLAIGEKVGTSTTTQSAVEPVAQPGEESALLPAVSPS
jgi:uncharacterized membrane protein